MMTALGLTMSELKPVRLAIRSQTDVISCRQQAREAAIARGFGLADQTRLATAVSELARNALRHAGGGSCLIHAVQKDARHGIQVVIEDEGPGIADIAQAMEDGFSTDRSLGLGLPASKRLVHTMDIDSKPGETTVRVNMYLPH